MIPIELKQKPQGKPALYAHRPRVKAASDAPKTFAITVKAHHANLTLQDWMMVFAYTDAHPDLRQAHIVQHFCTKQDGALLFDQATLSQELKSRADCVQSNPNVLSSKHPCVVRAHDSQPLHVTMSHICHTFCYCMTLVMHQKMRGPDHMQYEQFNCISH